MLKEKEVKQKQQTRLNRLDNPNEIEDDDHRHLVDQFGHFGANLLPAQACISLRVSDFWHKT